MRRTIRLGFVKAVPVKWNLRRNWATMERLIRGAADQRVDIFCTPECFLDGYVAPDKRWTRTAFEKIAQAIPVSLYVRKARDLARSAKAHIIMGLTEKTADGYYNTALFLDDHGEILGRYHKTHLQDHDLRYKPGQELPVFRTKFGTIGIVICADRRWPESVRTLRVKGAQLILMPTYGMWHEANEWWMRTRAYENEAFIGFVHPNVSLVVGPTGDIAAKLQSSEEAVLVHEIDLDDCPDTMFNARRPELYGALAKTATKTGRARGSGKRAGKTETARKGKRP